MSLEHPQKQPRKWPDKELSPRKSITLLWIDYLRMIRLVFVDLGVGLVGCGEGETLGLDSWVGGFGGSVVIGFRYMGNGNIIV